MILLILRTLQFFAYHLLISVVDRVSHLPRNSNPPDIMRILRENIALKAQVRALVLELKADRGSRPRVSMRTRAAQVFAYLLTRGDKSFQNYYLSASRTTLTTWATRFRRGPWTWRKTKRVGRPPLAQEIKNLIIELKKSNPLWGGARIRDELRRMGIKVSEPTVQKVLKEAGFSPRGGHPFNLERFRSKAKDAIWALDYFFVRSAKGAWCNVLLVVDLYTREIIELRSYDGWEADSIWTSKTFNEALNREGRKPEILVHDHGTNFLGQFERQLRVLEIERRRTPVALPFVNGIAERNIKSVRLEMLNHVRVSRVEELQWYLDEYKKYYNKHRANQALCGFTPEQRAQSSPTAEVNDLAEIKQRRLVHHSFAHGILNAYESLF